MNILKCELADLEKMYSITKSCGEHLIEKGIFQWNENYPSKEVLQKDIKLLQIWKLEVENEIVGIMVLTEIEDEEYDSVQWLTNNKPNLFIHRLSINPIFQGKGYAQKLMNFAENFAVENHYASIRLDTFSQNKKNQYFYEQRNYVKLESIYFPNQSEFPFYCYEKVLNV
jgi:ribosomal protein S18 acetylase RimI-like enzyme